MSPLIADAIAHPTAWMYCVPRLPEIVKNPASRAEYMTGIWRPCRRSLLVREDLAHHVDERPLARDQPALLAVGREEHVARSSSSSACPTAIASSPVAAHVERRLALALRPHASGRRTTRVVTIASQRRRAASSGVDVGRPRADGPALVVEHPDQRRGEVADVGRVGVDLGAPDRSGRRHVDIGEVGLLAGSRRRLRHPEHQCIRHSPDIVGGLWRQRIRRSRGRLGSWVPSACCFPRSRS